MAAVFAQDPRCQHARVDSPFEQPPITAMEINNSLIRLGVGHQTTLLV